jgi:putative ABC transport system ATP-binding protein
VTHDPDLARRAERNIQIVDGQVTDFKLYQGIAQPIDTKSAVAGTSV